MRAGTQTVSAATVDPIIDQLVGPKEQFNAHGLITQYCHAFPPSPQGAHRGLKRIAVMTCSARLIRISVHRSISCTTPGARSTTRSGVRTASRISYGITTRLMTWLNPCLVKPVMTVGHPEPSRGPCSSVATPLHGGAGVKITVDIADACRFVAFALGRMRSPSKRLRHDPADSHRRAMLVQRVPLAGRARRALPYGAVWR